MVDAFRVVIVNGPRQAGKSTLLRLVAENSAATMVSLDDRDQLRAARTDPGGFVDGYGRPLFIDEVQRGGDPLVLAIKAEVDRHSTTPGQFVLAGSSRFLTVPTLSESLAGRAAIVDLWPLSQGELEGVREAFVDRLFGDTAGVRAIESAPLRRPELLERVVRGGFPEVHRLGSASLRAVWFENYRRQLIERDLTQLRRIRQGMDLPRLLRALAARTAQELNFASISRDLGFSKDAARDYLALLETIYVHRLLPAWSTNLNARVKRHAKVHLVDSGLAADLLGQSVEALSLPTSAVAGPLLETFVVGELTRQRTWADVRAELFHFRDHDRREIDVILEAADGRIAAVEVKAARDVDEGDFRWLRYLRDRSGDSFTNGVLLHIGERPLSFGDRLTALPISALWAP